jgi:hypothetical protein
MVNKATTDTGNPPPVYEIGDATLEVNVDAEHIGIRTLMPLLAIGGFIGGIILGGLLAPLIDESGSLCFGIGLGLVAAVLLLQFGERVIKPRWGSGRKLHVDRSQLVLHDTRAKPPTETVIKWQAGVNVLAWYFIVPTGRSRVPKGWYCTAVRLTQDEQTIILYSFIKPEIAEQLPHFNDWFFHLRDKKEREAIAERDPQQGAKQERYRRLENERWNNGAELTDIDFRSIMELVAEYGAPPTTSRTS